MKATKYTQVADRIINLIRNGILKDGDRLPSMRQLCTELNVSMNTVKEAYWKLEKQNIIEAVPQSGFFVKKQSQKNIECSASDPSDMDPMKFSLCQIYGAFQSSGKFSPGTNLGIANINPQLWPSEKLGKYMQEAVRYHDNDSFGYLMSPGYPELRKQIARLGLSGGMNLSPDEIIITNGCHEAIFLTMMAVCSPGDTVIYESPVYFNSLQLLKLMNLKLIEVPSLPEEGINLDTLKFILENHKAKAMFTIPNFNNPLGFVMPVEKKKKLVNLLAEHGVVLIEDDIYGELYFEKRPLTCRAFDATGNVIQCSSISKSVAPGLRIGWVIPGKYYDRISELKTVLNISTTSITQIAAARFLKEGGYDRHMRKLREAIKTQSLEMRKCIIENFPAGTDVSEPGGGIFLWIKLPEHIDSFDIYQEALKKNILIAPGCLFSMKEKYSNYFRVNSGYWDKDIRDAVICLGKLCMEYVNSAGESDTKINFI